MTSALIPATVAVLAHKRLVDLVEALERKVGANTYDTGLDVTGGGVFEISQVSVNTAERRVLALAKAARDLFAAGPQAEAPHRLVGAQGIGRYAILGSAGFALPTYVEVFGPSPGWRAEAMRRGTPDPNLSRVVVGAPQFAIRTAQLALAIPQEAKDRERIRSFAMGLLSAVAAGVVVDPVLRGLQARRTRREWNGGAPAVDIAAAEARILRNVLGGGNAAALYQSWWPPTGDVPAALFEGYADAVEEVYFLAGQRPLGFAEFELGFEPGDALTAELLRDAYALLRLDAATSTWSWGTWLGLLSPVLLMPSLGLVLARALPHARAFFSASPTFDGRPVSVDHRAVHELLTLGLGLGSVPPFVYSMILWSQIPQHTESFVNALLLFLLRAVLVPVNLVEAAGEPDEGVLWGLLFGPLIAADVYAATRAALNRPGNRFVFFLQTLPAMTAVVMFLFAYLMRGVGIDSDLAFWLLLALLSAVVVLAIGIPVACALAHSGGLRSFFLPQEFPVFNSLRALTLGDDPGALAHLFDDSTLWHAPAAAAPGLPDLRYPPGPRALLRIWWEGPGELGLSHGGHTVTFRQADGTTVPVVLPPGERSAADLVALLQLSLAGVRAEVFHPSDPLYDLAYPHTLADEGDDQPTLQEHADHAADFVPVGKTKDEAFLLRHAPRVALTTTYGVAGASRSEADAIGLVPGQMLGDLEETAIGLAADLAVLLSLGAAPSLSVGNTVAVDARPPLPAVAPLGRVYQVFRQWNLDERRVNEWRMLVLGGAESEKAGDRAHADGGMRPLEPGDPGPYVSPVGPADPAGEPLVNAMGWVPLWRAWSRMATDLTADTSSAAVMPYTPPVARGGPPAPPANADLTTAIRFLLDLPA